MSVFQPVRNAVNGIAAVSGKVYHAEALKNASAPFVFWLQTGEQYEEALDGRTELDEDRYELHIVTKNLEDLDSISASVREAVEALQGTEISGVLYEGIRISQISPVLNEHEVNLYRKVYEITIFYQGEPSGGDLPSA